MPAVIYAHRPDHSTPIEETVRAFNFVIEQGWAFYWQAPQSWFLTHNRLHVSSFNKVWTLTNFVEGFASAVQLYRNQMHPRAPFTGWSDCSGGCKDLTAQEAWSCQILVRDMQKKKLSRLACAGAPASGRPSRSRRLWAWRIASISSPLWSSSQSTTCSIAQRYSPCRRYDWPH